VTPDSLENLYKLAKHLFDCGTYTKAAEYLQHYRALSTHADKNFSALWGKFAAEILKQNWNSALEDLKKLKEAIDTRVGLLLSPPTTASLSHVSAELWLPRHSAAASHLVDSLGPVRLLQPSRRQE
jgi:translation initiation factor 3 subunit E